MKTSALDHLYLLVEIADLLHVPPALVQAVAESAACPRPLRWDVHWSQPRWPASTIPQWIVALHEREAGIVREYRPLTRPETTEQQKPRVAAGLRGS